MKLTITLDSAEVKILEKRAKKNLLSLREQVEDIIRRSCIRSSKTTYKSFKGNDALVGIFSRDQRGRKKKKRKKKTKKKKNKKGKKKK